MYDTMVAQVFYGLLDFCERHMGPENLSEGDLVLFMNPLSDVPLYCQAQHT